MHSQTAIHTAIFVANILLPAMIALFAAAVVIAARKQNYKEICPYFTASLISFILCVNMSEYFKDSHPIKRLPDSFPSGHEAFMTTIAVSLVLLNRRLAIPAIALALLMAPALVIAGFHVWLDVDFSMVYATVVTLAVHRLFGTDGWVWRKLSSSQ